MKICIPVLVAIFHTSLLLNGMLILRIYSGILLWAGILLKSYWNKYTMENTSNLIPPTPKQKYVRGWLSFFLFVVGFGSLFSLIMSIVGFSSVDNVGFITCLFSGIDILFSLGLVALAGYTIYAFLYIRPNAVFLGKLYVIIIFISNMLVLLSGEMPDNRVG